MPVHVAGQHAEIRGLVTVTAECPAFAERIEDLCRCADRIRVFHDLDGRHRHQDVGFLFVEVDLGVVFVCHPLDAFLEHAGRGAQGAAFVLGAFRDRAQILRHEAGFEHALPHQADQRCDVDAHGANERAAAAHRA